MIRPASPADLPAVRAVADEHDLLGWWPPGPEADFLDAELAFGRLGVAAPDAAFPDIADPDAAAPDIAAPDVAAPDVAAPDAARVDGFAGTLPRGSLTHLGDLFVRVGAQSAGLGRALLGYALADAADVITFASTDPRALALYLRAGLVPRCPLVYLDGRLREAPRPGGTDTGDLELAVALDADASGGARPALLRWYAGLPGVAVHTVGDSYAFTRTLADRVSIGPAGGGPAVEVALAAAGGRHLHLAVPGPHPLLPRLVRAGLLIQEADTVMSTTPQPARLDYYLPHGDLG